MPKTYIQDSNLEASATNLASALGLPNRSAKCAAQKLRVREIGEDEKVFTFTSKGKYIPLKAGRGLLSAEDVAETTGVSLSIAKSYLQQPYGWHLPNGIYSCVVQNWKFKEND